MRFHLASFLIICTASMMASAPECIRSIGVFYDERHAFSIDAPPGWCQLETTPEEVMQTHQYTWRRIDAKDGPELMLCYDYLTNAGKGLEGLMRQDIAYWAARSPEEKPRHVQTADNRTLEYRCQELPKISQHQFIAYTIEEGVCAVRMILRARSKKQLDEFESAYRQFVSSYKRAR